MGQSGGGPLSSLGRMGSSMSSSSITSPGGALVHFRYLPFSWAHFQLQGFFCALAAWHTDKRQPPVDDGSGYCPNRMAIGKFLAIRSRNIDFTIRKTVLHAQLLPEAFGRRTSATARGDEQCDVRHRISVRGRTKASSSMTRWILTPPEKAVQGARLAVGLRREIFGAMRSRSNGWTDVKWMLRPGACLDPGSTRGESSVPQATQPAGLPCRRRSAEHRRGCRQDSPAAQRYSRTYWDNMEVATLA